MNMTYTTKGYVMIQIITISVVIFTLIGLIYQYMVEKIDENHKVPFKIK